MNDKPIQPKYTTKSFNLIKAKVYYIEDGIEKVQEHEAFNDICVGGDMNSWIDFLVNEKDEFFGEFKGGGLIISTPQGSTGINKNNNGSVLPLGADLWSITGDKTNRKIDYVIKPRKTEIFLSSRTPISVWVDGSNHIIRNVYKLELSKGGFVKVIFNDYSEFKRKRRM
jgi:NAD kinase